jgi:hypothetical protein
MSRLALAALAALALGAGRLPAEVKPAWPGVFPDLGMYSVTYDKPVVGKGEEPTAYRQKATYTWTGGRIEEIAITLARDPAFKKAYSEKVLKKEKAPPKSLKINKKQAWQWELPVAEGKFEVARRLVVVLADDMAIIIEQKGGGAELKDVAEKLDFAKVAKALARPPKK